MKSKTGIVETVRNKRILYIATKNSDYIRIEQEITILRQFAKSVDVISYEDKGYLKRVVKVCFKILKTSMKAYDIVFIGFMPQMIVPIWHWKFKKKIIITDFFISIYDTIIFDRKKFQKNCLISYLLKAIDKMTIKKSDYLISDTKEHAKYFCEELRAEENKIFVLYLEADKKIYYPMKVKRPEWLKNKFIVLYFGSILPVQGVDVVLNTIETLKDNRDIHFFIIGPIKNKIKKIYSQNVTYINWLPQRKLAQVIAASDLCLAGHFAPDINKAKRTIPGKAYIYEAMDKPMILGDTPANHELYSEDEKHFFVSLGNCERLAKVILEKKAEADER